MASSLTSFATTANPFPAARPRCLNGGIQGQQVGLLRNSVMTLITSPISALDLPSFATVVFAACAVCTALLATLAASCAWLEML